MSKLYKIINMVLIFMLIGVFLWTNLVHASNLRPALRSNPLSGQSVDILDIDLLIDRLCKYDTKALVNLDKIKDPDKTLSIIEEIFNRKGVSVRNMYNYSPDGVHVEIYKKHLGKEKGLVASQAFAIYRVKKKVGFLQTSVVKKRRRISFFFAISMDNGTS